MRTIYRLLKNHESGAAMVEFALVGFLLMVIFLTILDFGRAFFINAALSNAAVDGARTGIVQTSATCSSAVLAKVQTSLSGVNTSQQPSGWSWVQITCSTSGSFVTSVQVIINYKFYAVSSYFIALFGSQGYLNLHAQSLMTAY